MDGVWRTLCNGGLSIEAAEVVCRQLGYNVITSINLNYGYCCVTELCLASLNPR